MDLQRLLCRLWNLSHFLKLTHSRKTIWMNSLTSPLWSTYTISVFEWQLQFKIPVVSKKKQTLFLNSLNSWFVYTYKSLQFSEYTAISAKYCSTSHEKSEAVFFLVLRKKISWQHITPIKWFIWSPGLIPETLPGPRSFAGLSVK